MSDHPLPPADEFDLRVRAALSHAYDVGPPPVSLLRRPRLRVTRLRWMAAAACAVLGIGIAVSMLRPADVVGAAIAHDRAERSLKGDFVDARAFATRLQLRHGLPGVPQLTRPCNVDGKRAWHLVTYIEDHGMVSFFAFEESAVLPEVSSGWWANSGWRVVSSPRGELLLIVGASRAAVDAAATALREKA